MVAQGRAILKDTVKTVEGLNYEVIYGDTDSLFINTRQRPSDANNVTRHDLDIVRKIAEQIQRAVSPKYKYLVLGLDGVFRTLLLLKKKKYAALTAEEKNGSVISKRETKGLLLHTRIVFLL